MHTHTHTHTHTHMHVHTNVHTHTHTHTHTYPHTHTYTHTHTHLHTRVKAVVQLHRNVHHLALCAACQRLELHDKALQPYVRTCTFAYNYCPNPVCKIFLPCTRDSGNRWRFSSNLHVTTFRLETIFI